MVRVATCNLAIETSGARSSVALGRGDALLGEVTLPPPRRHRVDLMPAIDELCGAHGVPPAEVGEIYVSSGPGSFTGLRIGIATAQALAAALQARLVSVPTLAVLAANAPHDRAVAPCLNLKRDTVYCAAYTWSHEAWQLALEPALRTIDELLLSVPRGLTVVGDPLPEPRHGWPAEVVLLGGEQARPRAAEVWRLGRRAATQNLFVEPESLLPLYARPPEAVELWQARHSPSSTLERRHG